MVETILALQKTQASYDDIIRKLEQQLVAGTGTVGDLHMQLEDLRSRRSRIITSILQKRAALGVDEQAQLSHLHKSKYLQLRMNARAIKQRIRDRLRQRKFELERLERSYRQTTNSELSIVLCKLITESWFQSTS